MDAVRNTAPKVHTAASATGESRLDFFWLSVLIILVLQAVLLWYGLGRLPLAPALGDEFIINDPAIALSEGHGMIAQSLVNSHFGLDRLYAHFPPVYIALEALSLRLFGISAISLRALSVTGLSLAGLALAFILWLLQSRQIIRPDVSVAVLALFCFEPDSISLGRFARMDSLVLLFALLSFLSVLASHMRSRSRAWLLALGMLFGGLSLATHPEGILAILPALILTLLGPDFGPDGAAKSTFGRKAGGRLNYVGALRRLPFLALPLVVFAAIWVGTYRGQSLAALHQMKAIASYAPGPGSFYLSIHGFHALRSAGVVIGICCCFAWLLTLFWGIRTWSVQTWGFQSRRLEPDSPFGRKVLVTVMACAILEPLLLLFVFPFSVTRLFVVFPFALLGAGVAASRLRSGFFWILALAALVLAGEVLGLAIYFHSLQGHWAERSPARFQSITSLIGKNDTVIADADLWLALAEAHHRVAIIYDFLDEEEHWLPQSGHDPLAPFDDVILEEGLPDFSVLAKEARDGRSDQVIDVDGARIHLYRRTGAANR